MTDFLEHHTDSPICVVAFASSGANRNGVPVFEWKRTLDQLGVSYILLRDSTDRWYQDGVRGIGDGRAVAGFIYDATWRYSEKMCLGLSSGAYAAIKFGALAPIDKIVAISPVTVLGYANLFHPQYAHRVALIGRQENWHIDLRDTASDHEGIRAFVSDGDGAEIDSRMCQLINVTPTLIPGHSHAGLARHMVDTGLIQKLIMGEA